MDDRTRRIGLNEAVFREVNDRIEDVADAFGLERSLDLVCECGDAGCTERIVIDRRDYVVLRENPTLFAIYPGHGVADVESVVERREGYDVVRKHAGDPAALVEATDPRS